MTEEDILRQELKAATDDREVFKQQFQNAFTLIAKLINQKGELKDSDGLLIAQLGVIMSAYPGEFDPAISRIAEKLSRGLTKLSKEQVRLEIRKAVKISVLHDPVKRKGASN